MTVNEWERAITRAAYVNCVPQGMVAQMVRMMWHEAYDNGFADGKATANGNHCEGCSGEVSNSKLDSHPYECRGL